MIGGGVGIGVLPESSVLRCQRSANVHIIPLEEAWADRERVVVVRDLEFLPSSAKSLIESIFAYHGGHLDK